ncbi:hypothetical protein CEXT_257501 [Caerostris extrusa]|uniref:Uncharacterized protein n=1 Tax=Caerostris extrusa TaxID=172846 RepID=A0AAV4SB57_CAEEX|nr:hypothetical protein CEXT_257501 [Caerostris extrusa]
MEFFSFCPPYTPSGLSSQPEISFLPSPVCVCHTHKCARSTLKRPKKNEFRIKSHQPTGCVVCGWDVLCDSNAPEFCVAMHPLKSPIIKTMGCVYWYKYLTPSYACLPLKVMLLQPVVSPDCLD